MLDITKKDEIQRKESLSLAKQQVEKLTALQKSFEKNHNFAEYFELEKIAIEEMTNAIGDFVKKDWHINVDNAGFIKVMQTEFAELIKGFDSTVDIAAKQLLAFQAKDPNIIIDLSRLEKLLTENIPKLAKDLIDGMPVFPNTDPLDKQLKEIIKLLEAINKKPFGSAGPIGGGGGSSIPRAVIRHKDSIAVVNRDGTPIGGGTGGGLTDEELRASPVPVAVEGDVTITGDVIVDDVGLENIDGDKINPATEEKQDDIITELQTIQPQTDALTDTELRASPVDVDTGLIIPIPQTDALTDTELRDSPVDVDTGLNQPTTPSDTQPVSASSLPLPTGAATAANQQTDALTDTELRASAVDVNVVAGEAPVTNDGTFAKETGGNLATIAAKDFATSANQTTANTSLQEIVDAIAPGPIDSANSTQTPLNTGATYTGTWTKLEKQSTLFVFGYADQKFSTFQIQWSNNGTSSRGGALASSSLLTSELATGGFYVYLSSSTTAIDNYYRIVATNTSGTNMTTMEIDTWVYPEGFPGSYSGLSSTLSNLSSALLTRSVVAGYDPNETFTNTRVGGRDSEVGTTTPLGAGATYTSVVASCLGYASLEVVVATNQVSGTNGIVVSFYNDSTGTTLVDKTIRTYNAADVTNGSKHFIIPNRGDYYKIAYTNGGVSQGSFNLSVRLEITAFPQATDSIEGNMTAASSAAMVRAVGSGKNPIDSAYRNITASQPDSSSRVGQHIAIMKHDVSTPILALTSWKTGQATIASTSVAAQVIPAPTTGRKTFAIKALSSNSKVVFIGPTSGVTSGNGWELGAGEAFIVECDETAGVYVIGSTATSQTLCWSEVV